MSQQHESIWGTINTSLEIAINIFYLVGDKGTGLKMPASYGDNPNLQKFLEMGDREGDYLYFPETGEGYEELKETVCQEYAPRPVPQAESEMAAEEPHVSNMPNTDEYVAVDGVYGSIEVDEGENDHDGFEP